MGLPPVGLEGWLTEAQVPVEQAEVDTTEPPAQPLLPGLEPDDFSGAEYQPRRLTRAKRPRGSSDKRTFRMAQIELWPRPETSSLED